jgi:hypothetical protein
MVDTTTTSTLSSNKIVVVRYQYDGSPSQKPRKYYYSPHLSRRITTRLYCWDRWMLYPISICFFLFFFLIILSIQTQDCHCISFVFHPKSSVSKIPLANKTTILASTMGLTNNGRILTTNNTKKGTTTTTTTNENKNDAAVLRELKEIIQKQTLEITELKKKMTTSSGVVAAAAAAATTGHGGGETLSMDEITSYLHQPIYILAQRRVFWLSIFLCSLSLTAMIMSGFEHTLSRQIELAYFVPLLAGHGGKLAKKNKQTNNSIKKERDRA